jgi:hypothetical protein
MEHPFGPPSGLPPNPIVDPVGAAEWATRDNQQRAAAAYAAGLIPPVSPLPPGYRQVSADDVAVSRASQARQYATAEAAKRQLADRIASARPVSVAALSEYFAGRSNIVGGFLTVSGHEFDLRSVPPDVAAAALRAAGLPPTDRVVGVRAPGVRVGRPRRRKVRCKGWVVGAYSGFVLTKRGRLFHYHHHPTWETAMERRMHRRMTLHNANVGVRQDQLPALRSRAVRSLG